MPGLLRYQVFLSIGVLFLAIWKAGLSNLKSIQSFLEHSVSPDVTQMAVVYLPIWAVLALGLYALSCVLYRVATFGDCADAAVELSLEIEEAKKKLKERGFKF